MAGVDWGFSKDAATMCVLTAADPRPGDRPRYRVAWLLEEYRTPYSDVIDMVVDSVRAPGIPGYAFRQVVSELNGVGAMPSQELQTRLTARTHVPVDRVHTTQASKEDSFGYLKGLLQQGRLELPEHPGLLRQLAALEFTQQQSGGARIAVPERSGHDDLAMALAWRRRR